ncbi:hypothetical protein AOLI_G00104260 [Acnodon oligacanthus]
MKKRDGMNPSGVTASSEKLRSSSFSFIHLVLFFLYPHVTRSLAVLLSPPRLEEDIHPTPSPPTHDPGTSHCMETPGEDPGPAGGITSHSWPRNIWSIPPEELEFAAMDRGVWSGLTTTTLAKRSR